MEEDIEPRIAILTAITQSKEIGLCDPITSEVHSGVDYFAFTDVHYPECKVWKQFRLFNFSSIDERFIERRNAKLPKILGFMLLPGYDYYIWHDAYSEVHVHPKDIINTILLDNDIALFKHPARDCVYDELDFVKQINYDHHDRCDGMINFLTEQKFPRNFGMFEMSSFMYRNNEKMRNMLLSWWELICKYSSRDQCSFPYVLWKHNPKYTFFPGTARRTETNNPIIPQVRIGPGC